MRGEHAPIYDLTFRDVLDILRLIEASPFEELQVELDGMRLKVARHAAGAAAGHNPPAAAAEAAVQGHASPRNAAAEGQGLHIGDADVPEGRASPELPNGVAVKPPMAGTFYSGPAPGAAPFVEVGSAVRKGETVGIVEVMKLFTPIPSPCDGIVRAILVKNEEFVTNDRTLMIIEPSRRTAD